MTPHTQPAPHTAVPWESDGLNIHESASSHRVLATTCGDLIETKKEESDANAAFIVRAVNSHADLLAACQAFAALDVPAIKAGLIKPEVYLALQQHARAAIARATA